MRVSRARAGLFASASLLAFLSTGCANLTPTQQRAGTGTMAGAAGGALIGAIAGNAGMGAAIGAGAGLLGGLLVDQNAKAQDRAYQQGWSDAQRR